MRWWDGKENARHLAEQGIEVWSPVHLAPARYFVSNLGNIRSDVAGRGIRPLQPMVNAAGRPSVSVYVNAGDRHAESWLVYRLMLWAFDGAPPTAEHTDACHGVGGETDNRLCNLRWGTRSDNMQDVLKHRRLAVRERPKTERPETRQWYQGVLLDDDLVQRGLKLYDAKKITIDGLALLWECSPDSAGSIVRGRTLKHIERPPRALANGRVGEAHRDAVCTDAQILEALDLYVKNHWSCKQFAAHLSMKPGTADAILIGRNRAYLKKPEGFCYPWPDARTMNKRQGADHGCAKVSEETVREALQKIVAGEFPSVRAVQSFLGLAKGPTYTLLNGDSWAHIPRPEGFDAAVKKMQRTILSPETQEAIMADLRAGMSRKDVQEKYDLSQDKSYFYTSKLKAEVEANAAKDASTP